MTKIWQRGMCARTDLEDVGSTGTLIYLAFAHPRATHVQCNDREIAPYWESSQSICPHSLSSYTHALARRSTSSF